MRIFGYEQRSKGKTSGSRVIFKNSEHGNILFHQEPHAGRPIPPGALENIKKQLEKEGLL